MRRLVCLLAALFFVLSMTLYAESERKSVEVTVYNEDLGLVKEERTMDLKKGLNHIRLTDVPAQIEATSVRFHSLKSPLKTYVKEQNYEYDLASDAKLLHRYLDKSIEVITKDGKHYEGILISGVRQYVQTRSFWNYVTQQQETKSEINYSYGNLVIARDREKGPISIVQLHDNVREIELPSLPAGLITKPTLAWQLVSDTSGEHQCRLTYLTKGMNWRADYTALIHPDDTMLDLGAWVTINNHCGTTFDSARVKLMAGDVSRPGRERRPALRAFVYGKGEEDPAAETRTVFEYHLYPLDEITDLKDNQTKQIKLFKADKVAIEKFYVYDGVLLRRDWYQYGRRQDKSYGTQCDKKVMVFLEFVSSKKSGLGMALPRGIVRMYKRDEDGSLEFIGEDEIDHIPANERVRLRVGKVFDIVGERKQTDFKVIESGHIYHESFEIALRNQKKEDAEVRIVEHLYRWSDWEIRESSDPYIKTDSRTIEFRVKVPAGGEKKVTYTVRYRW